MQSDAGEFWNGVAQATHHVIERKEGSPPELDDGRLLGRREDSAAVSRGPMAASPVVWRARHWATVVGFRW